MPPIGPPPYTHEQISAMTSQEERKRAYTELASYIARLKKEKAERQNQKAQGYLSNRPSGSPHRKHGDPSQGSAHYHPYKRAPITDKGKSAVDSRDTSDAESLPKQPSNNTVPNRDDHRTNPNELCSAFTAAGVCSRPGCPYIHNPDKQAVCKHWFYKNACQMGKMCSLSHVATPHNTPTCTYFMAGRCLHDGCSFAHVRVEPSALHCEEFGSMGYCEKGDTCTKFHAHECPYFANTGTCRYGTDCRLGHCRRASRMKASRLSSPAANTPNRSNTPEGDMDAATVKLEQITPKAGADQQPHQFSQQADFVSFEDL